MKENLGTFVSVFIATVRTSKDLLIKLNDFIVTDFFFLVQLLNLMSS